MPKPEKKEPDISNMELINNRAERLEVNVQSLADDIGQRNMHTPGSMDRTVSWLEKRFREIGLELQNHTYTLQRGRYSGLDAVNVAAQIEGTEKSNEIVVIGAHYDSVFGSPGANDNASGVAVLLELAAYFAENPQPRTILFVSFANEEPPFFQTGDMGSYRYAEYLVNQGHSVSSMMALDGLGYFSDEPGSQSYPLPGLGFVYPKEANFIGLVTRIRNLGLLKKVSSAMDKNSNTVPHQAAALPGFIPGVNWSDHWSFWKHGVDAFLVTDTLLFRDPHYHTPLDSSDCLDYQRMAMLTEGLIDVVKVMSQTKDN